MRRACLRAVHDFTEVIRQGMAHDVFISHAYKDKRIAQAICEKLESTRVKCWIAERDISPGEDWTKATRRAIESSRVMVLMLSENANTSPHIEREIAHAFYTKREIIPVRLTQALPRRDFLFYLGDVRWFDAFSPPAEQHLDALTTSVTDLLVARSVPQHATPLHNAILAKAPSYLSDSWIGALRASHYQTLGILKRVAIAFSILAAVWMIWLIFWQAKPEVSPRGNDLSTLKFDPLRKDAEDPSITKPTYTYTRFGLWAPSNTSSNPSVQQAPEDTASPAGVERTSSPPPGVNQNGNAEAESLQVDESANTKPEQESPAPIKNRQKPHRERWRHKIQNRRVRASEERLAEIKKRLEALWRQVITLRKEPENR
jgi:hypothetical protein